MKFVNFQKKKMCNFSWQPTLDFEKKERGFAQFFCFCWIENGKIKKIF